jgi:hypothetical protein
MKAIRAFFAEQDETFNMIEPKATFNKDRGDLSSRRGGDHTDRKSVAQQQSIIREDKSLLNSSDNAEAAQSSIGRTTIKRKSTMACIYSM